MGKRTTYSEDSSLLDKLVRQEKKRQMHSGLGTDYVLPWARVDQRPVVQEPEQPRPMKPIEEFSDFGRAQVEQLAERYEQGDITDELFVSVVESLMMAEATLES